MNEKSVNLGKFSTIAAWTVSLSLAFAAWVFILTPLSTHVGVGLLATGVIVAILAATLQMRCYFVRAERRTVAALFTAARLVEGQPDSLRSIRP